MNLKGGYAIKWIFHELLLFPFNGGGGLAGNIIHHSIDSVHFVDDPVSHPRQQIIRQARPIGGHKVVGNHRPDGADLLVGALVAHHAHRADRQQDRERLAGSGSLAQQPRSA